MDQLNEYSNFKSVTDRSKLQSVAAVFVKKTGEVEFRIQDLEVEHTSDAASIRNKLDEDDIKNSLGLAGTKHNFESEPDYFNKRIKMNRKKRYSELYRNNFSDKTVNIESKILNIDNFTHSSNIVASGGNQLKFWPINLIKSIGSVIISFGNNLLYKSLIAHSPKEYPSNSHEKASKITTSEPTLLEMGDQWLTQTDMQGNIMWAILLTRKLTGKNPAQRLEYPKISTLELDIQALDIVDRFVQTVMTHAIACGIATPTRRMIEQSNLQQVTRAVHQKLAKDQVEAIPQLLCDQVVIKHIGKIAMQSTGKQAEKLLRLITKDQPKLQQFISQENAWWLHQSYATPASTSKKIAHRSSVGCILNLDLNLRYNKGVECKSKRGPIRSFDTLADNRQ